MIPMKHYEQFVGKAVTLGSDVGCLDALFGRLREIDGDTLIFDSSCGGVVLVDLNAINRLACDPGDEAEFERRVQRDRSDPTETSAMSTLADMFGKLRPRHGITVPPDTQADIDAMLADGAEP